jgi:hypothetical protein
MAAPSYVLTIARVAALLGEPEELLQDIAMDMEPEDGCLSVLDIDDLSTVAFTPQGIGEPQTAPRRPQAQAVNTADAGIRSPIKARP